MIKLLLLFACSTSAMADPKKGIVSGDQAAHSFLNKIALDKEQAGNHPFYHGTPAESNLNNSNLTQRSNVLMGKDPASGMVVESQRTNQKFNIDPQNDPLLAGSQKIIADPLNAIGGNGTTITAQKQGGADEIITCEEAGDDAEFTCKSDLIVTVKIQKGPIKKGSFSLWGPTVFWSYGGLLNDWPKLKKKKFVGHIVQNQQPCLKQFIASQKNLTLAGLVNATASQSGDWKKVRKKTYVYESYNFYYSYQPLIKVPYYSWFDGCVGLEARVDSGNCHYVSKVCTQGRETRIIDGISIKKNCWQYAYTYACSHHSKNDCGPLRARGCYQIKSACKEMSGKSCVNYLQTYQCKSNKNSAYTEMIQGGKTPFCLDGNCRDQSWESNDEMMSSIAQLSLLKEMQGQFANGLLFKGEDKRCSKFILSFKDCCGSGKGWGKDLGLASCSAGEKALSQKRKKGLCHFVGTYCDKKVLGKCVKKKSSYCCFTNKLLKAFHVQGRPQIGLGWGEPKHPLCRGFTIDEIQRIDFSKLDLREVFEDLMQNFKADKLNVNDMSKTINERMQTIQKSIGPSTAKNVRQRDGA